MTREEAVKSVLVEVFDSGLLESLALDDEGDRDLLWAIMLQYARMLDDDSI